MKKHIIEATLKNGVIWEQTVNPDELQDAIDYNADLYFSNRLIDFKVDGVLWNEHTYEGAAF